MKMQFLFPDNVLKLDGNNIFPNAVFDFGPGLIVSLEVKPRLGLDS